MSSRKCGKIIGYDHYIDAHQTTKIQVSLEYAHTLRLASCAVAVHVPRLALNGKGSKGMRRLEVKKIMRKIHFGLNLE